MGLSMRASERYGWIHLALRGRRAAQRGAGATGARVASGVGGSDGLGGRLNTRDEAENWRGRASCWHVSRSRGRGNEYTNMLVWRVGRELTQRGERESMCSTRAKRWAWPQQRDRKLSPGPEWAVPFLLTAPGPSSLWHGDAKLPDLSHSFHSRCAPRGGRRALVADSAPPGGLRSNSSWSKCWWRTRISTPWCVFGLQAAISALSLGKSLCRSPTALSPAADPPSPPSVEKFTR